MKTIDTIKLSLRNIPLYPLARRIKDDRDIVAWVRDGRPVPPPHVVKRLHIANIAKEYKISVFVETGTFLGHMVDAMKGKFDQVYTIEIDDTLYQKAREQFRSAENVQVLHGDSGNVLAELVPAIHRPALFWLDGHYSGGVTAMGTSQTPIMSELQAIVASKIRNHVVVIDDARCFDGSGGYPTLDEVRDFAKKYFERYQISVRDDLICILPEMSH